MYGLHMNEHDGLKNQNQTNMSLFMQLNEVFCPLSRFRVGDDDQKVLKFDCFINLTI